MGKRFLSIGECMVELSQAANGLLRKGFAGDTLNAAFYARACLPTSWTVEYLTALGDDAVSDDMEAFIAKSGIGTEPIRRIAGKAPGLYMISLHNGERFFSYWRESAAARQLAADPDHLRQAIDLADIIYFSGITLAILPPDHLENLLREARGARDAGKLVVFDPNIRPRLWPDHDMMRKVITAGASVSSLIMPSFEDEQTHFGDTCTEDTIRRYRAAGATHVVVKDGARGAVLAFGEKSDVVAAVKVDEPVDTTSAGDSFNGAFLAHYLQHNDPRAAAEFASRVAATVICAHGALVPISLTVGGVSSTWTPACG